MIFSLFYVSECTVPPANVDRAIDEIVLVSRMRNSALGITGALLFSGSHFAQFLEGAEQDVRSVMRSIARDVRHRDVVTLLEEQEAAPQFASWSLAYTGRSTFVQRRLDPLLAPRDPRQIEPAVREVVSMMRQFAAG